MWSAWSQSASRSATSPQHVFTKAETTRKWSTFHISKDKGGSLWVFVVAIASGLSHDGKPKVIKKHQAFSVVNSINSHGASPWHVIPMYTRKFLAALQWWQTSMCFGAFFGPVTMLSSLEGQFDSIALSAEYFCDAPFLFQEQTLHHCLQLLQKKLARRQVFAEAFIPFLLFTADGLHVQEAAYLHSAVLQGSEIHRKCGLSVMAKCYDRRALCGTFRVIFSMFVFWVTEQLLGQLFPQSHNFLTILSYTFPERFYRFLKDAFLILNIQLHRE